MATPMARTSYAAVAFTAVSAVCTAIFAAAPGLFIGDKQSTVGKPPIHIPSVTQFISAPDAFSVLADKPLAGNVTTILLDQCAFTEGPSPTSWDFYVFLAITFLISIRGVLCLVRSAWLRALFGHVLRDALEVQRGLGPVWPVITAVPGALSMAQGLTSAIPAAWQPLDSASTTYLLAGILVAAQVLYEHRHLGIDAIILAYTKEFSDLGCELTEELTLVQSERAQYASSLREIAALKKTQHRLLSRNKHLKSKVTVQLKTSTYALEKQARSARSALTKQAADSKSILDKQANNHSAAIAEVLQELDEVKAAKGERVNEYHRLLTNKTFLRQSFDGVKEELQGANSKADALKIEKAQCEAKYDLLRTEQDRLKGDFDGLKDDLDSTLR